MYMVHFQKSHTKRYDDPELMGIDIAEFLKLHPKRSVKVVMYL